MRKKNKITVYERNRIIMSVVLMGVIFSLTIVSFMHMYNIARESCWNTLRREAYSVDKYLKSMANTNETFLESVAQSLSSYDNFESRQLISRLHTTKVGVTKAPVRLYLPNDSIIANSTIEHRNNVYFDLLVSSVPYISIMHQDPLQPERNIMEHFYPVKKGDKTIAMVSCVIDLSLLPVYFPSTAYEGQADTMFYDKRNDCLFLDSDTGKISYMGNFEGQSPMNGYAFDKFWEDIHACRETAIGYSDMTTGEATFLYAVPSEIPNWMTMLKVSDSVAFRAVYDCSVPLITLGVLEILVFCGYMYWLYRTTKKQIREETAAMESAVVAENTGIIESMASDFLCMYYVDLAANRFSDEAKPYRTSKFLQQYMPDWDQEVNLQQKMYIMRDTIIDEEDRDDFSRLVDRARILKVLEIKTAYFVNFKTDISGETLHFQMKFSAVRNAQGIMIGIVFGIHSVDDQTRRLNEALDEQMRLRENVEREHADLTDMQDILQIGSYRVWFDENGEPMKAEASDALWGLLEYTEANFTVQTIEDLLAMVHAEDTEAIRENFNKAATAFDDAVPFDMEFRVITQKSEQLWVRNVVRFHRDRDGKPVYAIGVFEKKAAEHAYLETLEEKDTLQDELDVELAHLRIMNEITKAGMWSFVVSAENKIMQMNWSTEFWQVMGFDDEEDFAKLGIRWADLLYSEDAMKLNEEFRKAVAGDGHFDTEFRGKNRKGELRWYAASGRKCRVMPDGSQEFCGILTDVTDAHLHEEMQGEVRKTLEVIEILASEYTTVGYVDIKTGIFKPYFVDPITIKELGNVMGEDASADYGTLFKAYVERGVYEPDKESVLAFADLNYVAENLRNVKSFLKNYRTLYFEEVHYIEMKFVKVDAEDAEPTAFVVGFSDRDEQVAAKYVFEKLLEKFYAIYLFDLENEQVREIVQSRVNGIQRVERRKYSNLMSAFAAEVDEEFRPFWTDMIDPKKMQAFMTGAEHKSVLYSFSKMDRGKRVMRRAVLQTVEKRDGVPIRIILSFMSAEGGSGPA